MFENFNKPEKLRPILELLGGFSVPTVHIAGSKGKGTTATLLAKILEMHGKKVGLFTSPAILDDSEMIQINGRCIERERLERLIRRVKKVAIGILELNEFEILTLAALIFFREEACDFAVLECGLGGIFDATNMVESKVLTILTHVEVEHADVLGSTLGEITQNKLGICRVGVPLLTVRSQKKEVLAEIFARANPIFAPQVKVGYHHPESAGLAVKAAEMLGYKVGVRILSGLKKVVIPGRFEFVRTHKHAVILDGAHTFDSIQHLLCQVRKFAKEGSFDEVIFGIHTLKDKPQDLWKLFPKKRTFWVQISDPRAGSCPEGLQKLELVEFFKSHDKQVLLVIAGSFKLVKAAKLYLKTL
ncbi:MAG: cyanophycin synthetase [Candidatus Gracilibacteria bacterium]|jgi:dihydrofolate synthase/folylpolyglutamate synthase